MSIVRLPSWREVLDGPWALRLRSGSTGPWLMRGEARDDEIDVRFLAAVAARTSTAALSELGTALELEVPLGGFDELPAAVAAERPVALLVLDAQHLLADEPTQLATLVAALQAVSERIVLRVIFQARELTPDAEAVLAEFGVAEILA